MSDFLLRTLERNFLVQPTVEGAVALTSTLERLEIKEISSETFHLLIKYFMMQFDVPYFTNINEYQKLEHLIPIYYKPKKVSVPSERGILVVSTYNGAITCWRQHATLRRSPSSGVWDYRFVNYAIDLDCSNIFSFIRQHVVLDHDDLVSRIIYGISNLAISSLDPPGIQKVKIRDNRKPIDECYRVDEARGLCHSHSIHFSIKSAYWGDIECRLSLMRGLLDQIEFSIESTLNTPGGGQVQGATISGTRYSSFGLGGEPADDDTGEYVDHDHILSLENLNIRLNFYVNELRNLELID